MSDQKRPVTQEDLCKFEPYHHGMQPMCAREFLKTLLLLPLALVRFLLILVSLVLAVLALLPMPYFEGELEAGAARRAPSSYYATHFALPVCKLLCYLFLFGHGVVLRRRGRVPHELRDHGLTVVGNHTGLLEGFVAFIDLQTTFVVKGELRDVPLLGAVLESLGCLFVTTVMGEPRSDAARRLTVAKGGATVVMNAWQREASGQHGHCNLLVFPEGTTTNGAAVVRFRTGPFVAHTPVLPLVHCWHWSRFNPAYDTIPTFTFYLRLLTQVYNLMEVEYLPLQVPGDEERNARVYADRVSELMADRLGVPRVDSTVDDKMKSE